MTGGRRRSLLLAAALGCLGAIAPVAGGAGMSGAKAIPASAWRAAGVTAVEPAAAPVATLSDLAGRPVRVSELRGRVVMLYFWATW